MLTEDSPEGNLRICEEVQVIERKGEEIGFTGCAALENHRAATLSCQLVAQLAAFASVLAREKSSCVYIIH